MSIRQLVMLRDEYTTELRDRMVSDHATIKQLAEDMAECATNMQGHGYRAFIQARETFLSSLADMQRDYCELFTGPNRIV